MRRIASALVVAGLVAAGVAVVLLRAAGRVADVD